MNIYEDKDYRKLKNLIHEKIGFKEASLFIEVIGRAVQSGIDALAEKWRQN